MDLKELLKNNPDKTLEQMAEGLPIKQEALRQRLLKAGFTFKNKSYTYSEGNPELQKGFVEEIQKKDPTTLFSLDESGFEERAVREKGWALKGQRLEGKKKATAPNL